MKKVAIYQNRRAGDAAWYNKWVQSPLWLRSFGGSILLCFFVYGLNVWLGPVDPGSVWGLGYGISGAFLFLGAFFYAFRRRTIRTSPLQRAWHYLQFHVYGGSLFLLLIFLHTNFHWPEGVLTGLLWAGSVWVVVTGWIGNILQKWIPTVLRSGLQSEVHFSRIPELVEDNVSRMEALVKKSSEPIQRAYRGHIASGGANPVFRWIYLFDAAGSIARSVNAMRHTQRVLDLSDKQHWEEIQSLYQSRLELDAHYTLQTLLRAWLILHVPFAVITLLLVVIHVFAVIYY